jgi:hypothetical protein
MIHASAYTRKKSFESSVIIRFLLKRNSFSGFSSKKAINVLKEARFAKKREVLHAIFSSKSKFLRKPVFFDQRALGSSKAMAVTAWSKRSFRLIALFKAEYGSS